MTQTAPIRRLRAGLALVLTVGLSLGLAACSDESFAQNYGTADKGYVAGDGSWQELPAEQRGAAVSFSGETSDGSTFTSADYTGQVMVVNFWYAACPPCRAEAKDLQKVADEQAANKVQFVGVNIYDQAATAQSFEDSYGITYPSILDVDSAAVRLAFSESVPPQAIPSTVVLDHEGRVAAVVRGPIDTTMLGDMIDRVVAEKA
ncbi:TlpA family protein disulfide reductase [Pseudoclavibacter albus]|uniref:TlpA family protein disulfide reductase n=1 Tax=Pseudoclavibacter albus TaxID=272241 RepID=UPI0030B97EE9